MHYSPDAHCFCPMCSWMVEAPNLKTKTPSKIDKRRALALRINAVQSLIHEEGLTISADVIEEFVDADEQRASTALLAYGADLLSRLEGNSVGPSTLVLWRGFAWTAEGSPTKDFELSAGLIVDAELKIRGQLHDELSA